MSEFLLTRPGACPIPPRGRKLMVVGIASLALHAFAVLALTLYHNALSVEETTCPVTNLIRVTLIQDAPKPAAVALAAPAKAQPPKAEQKAAPAPLKTSRPSQLATTRPQPKTVAQSAAQPAAAAATPAQAQTPAHATFALRSSAPAAQASGQGSSQNLPLAQATSQTPIPYPPLARRRGYEGTVILHLRLAREGGRPQAVRIAGSSGFEVLDQTAFATVKKWSFAAPQGNEWHQLPVRFALTD